MDQLKHAQAAGCAFAGFVEGAIEWAPTFKVKRTAETAYKAQRVPSYCDRVLWKSMPALRDTIVQTEYTSVPAVSTSDHKPVVAHFTITPPIMPPPRVNLSAAPGGHYRVQIQRLQLQNILAADLGHTSDPYCVFYSAPRGLLDAPGVRTAAKYKVPGIGATGGAIWGERLRISPKRASDGSAPSLCMWEDHELPLLKLRVGAHESLENVCLIIAIFDKDIASADDPLGVVWLPLGRQQQESVDGYAEGVIGRRPSLSHDTSTREESPAPAAEGKGGSAAGKAVGVGTPTARLSDGNGAMPTSYTLRLEEPILFGHTQPSDGKLRCEMHVTFRQETPRSASNRALFRSQTALEDATILERARRDENTIKWCSTPLLTSLGHVVCPRLTW